jgi:hypothetical protein
MEWTRQENLGADAVIGVKGQKSNRRSHLPGYAALEIHPVMRLEITD